ncbi:fructosamine kinase family protein [Rubrolithibacter danxiaensis]|uniref:fructosamine kinase family protein n=1 Tax=Rubrolithibacter danxiaensis TaxID=3390805 RepID=UPI003BF85EE9
MFLTEELTDAIQHILEQQEKITKPVLPVSSVSGGSINSCYKLKAGERSFFLKVNSSLKYPRMFLAEAEGLRQLRKTQTIAVPDVVGVGFAGQEQFLILNWIEEGNNSMESQQQLGFQLADLHKNKGKQFGLDHDNYMGSLTQTNKFHTSWTEFFISQRLEPQLKIGVEKGLINNQIVKKFYLLFKKLNNLYPAEEPSLVHGDLWSGNYLISLAGKPVVIDPAVAYAHREADIAMTRLFGGFSPAFYAAYNENNPLEKNWEERISLWNLYPLLVHVNLFGGGYIAQVKSCLQHYL